MSTELAAAVDAKVATTDMGALGVVQREQSRIQAELLVAQHFPRDMHRASQEVAKLCSIPRMAADARYNYSRGGSQITGPTAPFLRAVAACWTRVNSGIEIVAEDDEYMTVEGWAQCLQSLRRVSRSQKVRKAQQRKNRHTGETEWVPVDERDKLELMLNRGARLERNALEAVMPVWLVDEALERCFETNAKAAAGNLEMNRDQTLRAMTSAFAGQSVTLDMLEGFLGHPIADTTPDELVKLRELHGSIKKRTITVDEAFGNVTVEASAVDERNEKLAEEAKKAGKKKTKAKASTRLDFDDEPAPASMEDPG